MSSVRYEVVAVDALEAGGARGVLARGLRWAGVAALVALAFLAVRKLDLGELRQAWADASAPLLAAATALNVLALALQAGRWLSVVHPVVPEAKARDAFFTLVAGYAVGLLVPARASDLARAHLMARRSGASMATLAATAVVDHLLGSLALLGALGLVAAASPLPPWLRSAGTLAIVGAGGALAALWLLRPSDGVTSSSQGLAGVLARVRCGLVAVGRPRALFLSWVFALGGWATEMLIAYLSLLAFGLPATVSTSLLVVLATTLSAAISVSPGNAGAFELACLLVLSGVGVAREPSLAFAIGYHAAHVIPVGLLGGGWLLAHGYKAGLVREIP